MNRLIRQGPAPWRSAAAAADAAARIRSYSLQGMLPRFTKNIFSRTIGDQLIESNPLLEMSRSDILALKGPQYQQLAMKPMHTEHSHRFCQNIVSIVEDNIIENTRLAASLMRNITNNEVRQVIVESLQRIFFDDDIKLSLVELMAGNIDNFRPLFLANVENLLKLNQSTETKRSLLKHYFQNLCYFNTVVPDPIVVPTPLYKDIHAIMGKESEPDLYAYMFNLNLAVESGMVRSLQDRLMRGSALHQYVVRTGKINCKWHDTVKSMSDDQIPKASAFLSFDMLRIFAFQAVKRKDIVDSNIYLELVVKKFEQKASEVEDGYFVLDVQDNLQKQVQVILKLIVFYIMTFKGPKNCFKILDFIVKNNLSINFDILITAMANLRIQGYHDEAILLINNISLDKISNKDKQVLANEILKLMKVKYPDSPKVQVGYANAMFKRLGAKYAVVDLLNDLKLLGISYGFGKPARISSTGDVVSATVDSNLTNIPFTFDSLAVIYRTHMSCIDSLTPDDILVLFNAHMEVIKDAHYKFLKPNKLTLDVLNVFVGYLLKAKPESRDMTMIRDKTRFDIAKQICTEFFKSIDLNHHNVTPHVFETLIYSSLMVHNDYEFASQMLRTAQLYKVPCTFNQLYPFIMYHGNKKQPDIAEHWYKLLVQHGVQAKSPAMKEVYKMARDHNWDVKGFVYRKSVIQQNHAKRKVMSDLEDETLPFASNMSFHDSLSALLNGSK